MNQREGVLKARIDAALALHPRSLTVNTEPVPYCVACSRRWPCANVRALTGEGT